MMNKLNAPLNEAEIRQAVVQGDGLPQWTTADRDIDNKHIVVWHTVNYHHWPRPEDWPVQALRVRQIPLDGRRLLRWLL
jgi:Cu2+-containing amine oxidase